MLIARHLREGSIRVASVVDDELIDLDTDHDDLPQLLATGLNLQDVATGTRTALSDAHLLAPVAKS